MKFLRNKIMNPKYLLLALQALIIIAVLGNWLISRGNAYNRVFILDECALSQNAVLTDSVTTDSSLNSGGTLLRTPAVDLDKGSYLIHIYYNATQGDNTISVSSNPVTQELIYSTLTLDPEQHTATMNINLNHPCEQVAISANFSGAGSLTITNISIHETSGIHKQNLFHALLLCLLINLLYYFKQSDTGTRKIMLALSGLLLVSCYPLYTDYLIVGHDMPFHLLRIEAISEGLKAGIFPVKVHPFWAKGNGYAVGIFYGDAFLYFPALLRLLEFSVQTAYKYFVVAVNLGTILISYYSFKTMFTSRKTGVLGSVVYTMSLYRLADTYTRAAVGEYTAMMCFPLILCGFYLIFTKSDKQSWWKHALLTALGLTGVIQSHVLSCLMLVFVIFLVCILLIKQVIKRYTFLSLVTAAFTTLGLNLGFIVPFLDFYGEDIFINSPDWVGSTIGSFQGNGLFPLQIFSLFSKNTGGAWHTINGICNEATYSIGIVLTFGLGLCIYLLATQRKEYERQNYYASLIGTGISCLLLFMCTCYFPWDALTATGKGISDIIYSLEFPWRLLAPATLLLTFLLCCSFSFIEKNMSSLYMPLVMAVCLLMVTNCGWYFYDLAYNSNPYRVYEAHELNTMTMYSYDYLPTGTNPDDIRWEHFSMDGVTINTYQRKGTTIYLAVNTTQMGGYIDLPLTYYKYYQCIDTATKEHFPIEAGSNQVVRVNLPGNYSGDLKVSFVEPWFWRASEAVSAVTLLIIVISLFRKQLSGIFRSKKHGKKIV